MASNESLKLSTFTNVRGPSESLVGFDRSAKNIAGSSRRLQLA